MLEANASADLAPGQCSLEHKLFKAFGNVLFCRSPTDNTPVMTVRLGENQVVLPLPSIMREFGIDEDSPDGRMLALIAESLDFVNGVQLGDALPREVIDGSASWDPEERHRAEAQSRLRAALIRWCGEVSEHEIPSAADFETLDTNPRLRVVVQRAFDEAARVLDLREVGEVMRRVEALADELAFIEALRDLLLRRVQALSSRLERLALDFRGESSRVESLRQVRRLTGYGLNAVRGRFEEVDSQTNEIMPALRNTDGQTTFIRSHRDWLYRGQRAWDPFLTAWEATDAMLDDAAWQLIARTYRFLAPRFMPTQEWVSAHGPRTRVKKPLNAMTW